MTGWVALAMAGTASAATGSASVSPATAAPGDRVDIVFTVETGDAVELILQETIRCVVEGPTEAAVDCSRPASLADVRVLPGSRQYAFSLDAPSAEGDYAVTITRENTLSVPPAGASATATFTVASSAAEPIVDASGPLLVEPPAGGGDDAGRWLASSTMATAALVGAIVVGRRGLGGLR